VAFDPVQRLLAVGTKSGSLRLYPFMYHRIVRAGEKRAWLCKYSLFIYALRAQHLGSKHGCVFSDIPVHVSSSSEILKGLGSWNSLFSLNWNLSLSDAEALAFVFDLVYLSVWFVSFIYWECNCVGYSFIAYLPPKKRYTMRMSCLLISVFINALWPRYWKDFNEILYLIPTPEARRM
jgi:hypothetical protein